MGGVPWFPGRDVQWGRAAWVPGWLRVSPPETVQWMMNCFLLAAVGRLAGGVGRLSRAQKREAGCRQGRAAWGPLGCLGQSRA